MRCPSRGPSRRGSASVARPDVVCCLLCSRSVFDFSEDEVDTLWASVDANATGVIARPRAALLLKRAVILQHGKMGAMVQDKLAKEEAIEAGSIRGIPRWMQWCARETERQRDRETERQRRFAAAYATNCRV